MFWLLTMLAYARYCERRSVVRYILTLVCFIFGLMSKPILVTLPFVLLLMDYWPLRRLDWRQSSPGSETNQQNFSILYLIVEKTPFFISVTILSIVTYAAEKTWGFVASLDQVTPKLRVGNALVSYIAYIWKMIWPQYLAVNYPLPDTIPLWKSLGAGLLLAFLSAVFVC